MRVVESVCLDCCKEVKSILPRVLEIISAASCKQVKGFVGGKIACDLIDAVAFGGVGIEHRWCCISKVA